MNEWRDSGDWELGWFGSTAAIVGYVIVVVSLIGAVVAGNWAGIIRFLSSFVT